MASLPSMHPPVSGPLPPYLLWQSPALMMKCPEVSRSPLLSAKEAPVPEAVSQSLSCPGTNLHLQMSPTYGFHVGRNRVNRTCQGVPYIVKTGTVRELLAPKIIFPTNSHVSSLKNTDLYILFVISKHAPVPLSFILRLWNTSNIQKSIESNTIFLSILTCLVC